MFLVVYEGFNMNFLWLVTGVNLISSYKILSSLSQCSRRISKREKPSTVQNIPPSLFQFRGTSSFKAEVFGYLSALKLLKRNESSCGICNWFVFELNVKCEIK